MGGDVCLKFFKNIRDIDVLRLATAADETNHYVGVFDIPLSMVRKVSPAMKYPARGYDVDYQTIKELAVPVFKIKPEFFTAVVDDKSKSKTPAEILQEISTLTTQNQPQ